MFYLTSKGCKNMKKIKRLFTFAMALMIALSCFGISVSAVESDAPDDNGNMELDVVFVLDSSGSMAESDPNRVAPDAFKRFRQFDGFQRRAAAPAAAAVKCIIADLNNGIRQFNGLYARI